MSVQNDVLWRDSAAALAARLACGELSARAVVEAHLDRIAATDSALSAFITVAADKALARAEDLDATLARTGRPVGPLHGVPVALKDLTDTAGIRTTYGSGIYADHVPASFCGVASIRPTPGLVPAPKLALGWDTLATHGVIARDTADCALMLGTIAGMDADDPTSLLPPLRDDCDGLPCGLQLIARPGEERRLIRFGRQLERGAGFVHRWPPISAVR
ncbi:Amidase [Azospirillum oryzae]|uniref:Amidase n=1 Tax=Azospirillum oryzae TaxID=286727 RepID=A0A1X7HM31_9PROT|nr:amidase family protein [Azospirillum oryzae]SMF89245.1 Amidase [Azospirillum oryzae]